MTEVRSPIDRSPMHIHFIGICGVAMNALAIACKKQGYHVTGSDKGFYPPVSTHLADAGIEFYPGWHPDKMGTPDLVVVGNVAGSTNPEWSAVQAKKIPYLSYPEFIAKYIVKDNSIVCAGTYGKTSTAALLAWILKNAGMDPSYMFGGIAINSMDSASFTPSPLDKGERPPEGRPEGVDEARNSTSPYPSLSKEGGTLKAIRNDYWSILEGDEYKTARWDERPKFAHYSPTHLLLTAVEWDHADLYPTEESYLNAFRDLVKMVPNEGTIVACTDDEHVSQIIDHGTWGKKTYGASSNADYQYTDIQQTKNGLTFNIKIQDSGFRIQSPLLGSYQAANITGAFAMASEIGIAPEKIIESIATFNGLKRRLEKRYEGDVTIFDDIAHSPAKAASVLKTLKEIYNSSTGLRASKIIAIFEPNTGNRRPEAKPTYDNAFASADEVIIPRLTSTKIDPNQPAHMEATDLVRIISKTHSNCRAIEDDDKLIEYLKEKTQPNDVIVFLGSHGFRGMIERLISLHP